MLYLFILGSLIYIEEETEKDLQSSDSLPKWPRPLELSQEEGSLGAESAALPVPQGRWWQVSQGGLASGVRGRECLETHYQARESAQLPE